jgi:hypothetical protein
MSLILNGTNGLSDVDGTAATPAIRGTDANTGIFFPAADTIAFSEGGVESMRINSNGEVGIGTASPSAPADVVSNSSAIGVRIRGRSSDSYGVLEFTNNGASAETGRVAVDTSGNIIFSNGAAVTERARIDSSGNVGINTSTPTQRLSVSGNINVTSGNQLIAGSTAVYADGSIGLPSLQWNSFTGAAVGAVSIADTTATASSIYFRNPNGFVGNINTNGSSTNYVTTSDYRLKENVLPMQNALATVAALKPCTYTWKVDGNAGQGFIAHELQAVVPDCVTGEKDAVSADGSPMYQGVDTSFLVATLVAAIQELKAEVDALKGAA